MLTKRITVARETLSLWAAWSNEITSSALTTALFTRSCDWQLTNAQAIPRQTGDRPLLQIVGDG